MELIRFSKPVVGVIAALFAGSLLRDTTWDAAMEARAERAAMPEIPSSCYRPSGHTNEHLAQGSLALQQIVITEDPDRCPAYAALVAAHEAEKLKQQPDAVSTTTVPTESATLVVDDCVILSFVSPDTLNTLGEGYYVTRRHDNGTVDAKWCEPL